MKHPEKDKSSSTEREELDDVVSKFKLRWSQIILYFIVIGLLVTIFLMKGFPAWAAGMMALGIMLLLILCEYAIVGYFERKQEE